MKAVIAGVAAAAVFTLCGETESAPSGKQLFEKRCGGCHALDRDKEGPRLRGVVGRAAGSIESFSYSEALKGSKVTWTRETLEKWLENTDAVAPGNDMTFRVEKPDERAAIIEYLKTAR